MSLSKLLSPPIEDLLPGRRLAPRCTLGAIAAAEEFFIQHHVSLAASNADHLTESALAAVRSYAAADAARWFRYGTTLFSTRILSGRGKILTICLALRDADPACRDISWEVARDLAQTADPTALDEFVPQYWGWADPEKKAPAATQAAPATPPQSTGPPSSPASSTAAPAGLTPPSPP